jgi:hypothetical protein
VGGVCTGRTMKGSTAAMPGGFSREIVESGRSDIRDRPLVRAGARQRMS